MNLSTSQNAESSVEELVSAIEELAAAIDGSSIYPQAISAFADACTAIATVVLAYLALREIRNSLRDRKLSQVTRELERSATVSGFDFLVFISFSVERWWKDEVTGEHVREMQQQYDNKRASFRDQSKSLRPELLALKGALLDAHPETGDAGKIGQEIIQ